MLSRTEPGIELANHAEKLMVPSPYYENRLYCNTGWNRQGPSFPSKASADPKGQEEKGQ